MQEKGAALSKQCSQIKAQGTEFKQKAARKAELTRLIPQKETDRTAAESELTSAKENLAAQTVAAAESANRIQEQRAKLSHPDRKAAEAEKDALQRRLEALKKAERDAETQLNQAKESLSAVRAAIEQLEKQLAEGTDADADALENTKAELDVQRAAIRSRLQDLHSRLTANERTRGNISDRSAELVQLDTQYTWLKALSETANGTITGKDKIMLETYVQTTYFDLILERANIRLQKMSGGQYDLKRRRTAASMRGQSGLELDIIDHINATERSVNTLSGGEAFLASLALALGLSDEVQMSTGIRLDTLFVDEGFGSLDSESLSKAYNTLAALTEGNRLVGIISHVSELKERIDRQIIVTKQKNGESAAKISI